MVDALTDTTEDTQIVAPVQTVEYDVEVRNDLSKREIDMRLVPWGVLAQTANGVESFERGAFRDAVPSDVLLHGLEHEAFLGLGQAGQPKMTRHPIGKAIALDDREDGQHVTFRVAKTARGDEVLALADEGIVRGVSVEFAEVPGGTRYTTSGGRRHVIHTRARLAGASTTYRPSYQGAEVIAVRSKESTVVDTATPEQATPAPPVIDMTAMNAAIEKMADSSQRVENAIQTVQTRAAANDELIAKILEQQDKMAEQARSAFTFPSNPEAGKTHPDDFTRGDWLKTVLKVLSGEQVSQADLQARAAEDLITSDNLGVIPTAYVNEVIGIINPSRPFLASTRRINTPRNGMTLSLPKIVTRPAVGVQDPEKELLATQATSIVPATFDATSIGGYGDISIQLLKRSDPSYLEMYVDLLAEAYAIMADDKAVDALLAENTVVEGGSVFPGDGAQFGDAWANATAVSPLLLPDTIWLSSAAVAAFIDAKSDTNNAPLYANLAANFTAAGGVGGTISGLRPVHVPALNDEAVDIIVGPSRGFLWTEDGTYTLQVDVPAKAGRDVGIIGMIWYAPIYPAAFTTYELASS